MAAAQMRKMMEGVVLYGSGKPAQLNGYSAGGKTGTAQKIDPATHLYSKTMHIASFAGIAPVNNPAIAVAVVIDNPRSGPSYYGTAVSAPVFGDVAQQVLEYLGVPHDIDVKPPKTAKEKAVDLVEDDSDADQEQVNSLFAAVNDLPADDPLRNPQPVAQPAAVPFALAANQTSAPPQVPAKPTVVNPDSASPSAALDPKSTTPQASAPPHDGAGSTQVSAKLAAPQVSQVVTISDGKKLTVPSLVGLPLRKVIEMAATAGLNVEIVGDGIAREQAPAPGTKVPNGTRIVVRFSR